MEDFRYLQYCTLYSCSGDLYNSKETANACFSKIFWRNIENKKVSEKYDIVIYKGLQFSSRKSKSNACILSRREIRKHLDCAKRIFDFEYSFSNEKRDGLPVYVLHVNVKNSYFVFHKFLLAWIRYLYEYPYNVLLLDVLRLKRRPEFRFTSRTTLMNLVIGCYYSNEIGIHQIPSTQRVVENLTINKLRERIKRVSSLNAIYNTLSRNENFIPENSKVNGRRLRCEDMEFWDNDEIYINDREPVYLSTYKKIKQYD